jgi:SAM-dependent methyltransferase
MKGMAMARALEWRGRVGREWAARDAAMDGLLGPAGRAGLARLAVRPGERVLDLGCGSGHTAVAMAGAGAVVTGIDISPDLLALARARSDAVTWIEADAATAALPGPFDALYSRCGAMFFDEPVPAWAHLRAAMLPAGRMVVVCWREAAANGWATVPLDAAAPVLGPAEAPRGTGPGPFSWAEPGVFAPILEGAGWRDVAWEGIETVARLSAGDDPDPVARAVAFTLRIGTMASRLEGRPPEQRAAVAERLAAAYAPLVRNGAVELPAAAWIVTARA